MMKKEITVFLLIALTAALFTACSKKETGETDNGATGTYTDYIDNGKVFAAQIGDVYGAVANDIFKAAQVQEFILAPDMLEAVRQGKVDAAILDDAYVKQIADSGQYPDLDYLPVPKEVFVNLASNVFHTGELRDKFNKWFETILEDGTFDEIYGRWIGVSLPEEKDIPRFELTAENGTLKVCNTGNFPPFSYVDSNNQPVGFDEEILSRFAAHLGMAIEYNMMAYDAIIPYVLSGKADMSGCSFTVTDERSDGVIFGAAYTKARAVLVINKGETAAPRDYTAFSGKDIAVITGVLTVNTTEKIGGNPIEYNDSASAAADVRLGRVAGYMHALTAVQVMASQMDGFEAIPVPKDIFSAQIGAMAHDQATIDSFNTFLAAIRADGTLNEMQSRWFGQGVDLDAPMPEIQNSSENGMLDVAICSDSIPYVFAGAYGEYSGYSVELALRFGAYVGKTIRFTEMEFGALLPYIVSEKADLAIANIAITEERKKSVLFTEPFFDEQHGILALVAADDAQVWYTDFFGKRFAVKNGTIYDAMSQKFEASNTLLFEDYTSIYEAVLQGRADVGMRGYWAAYVSLFETMYSELDVIAIPESLHSNPIGAISMNQDIIDDFNLFLAALKESGIYDEMRQCWFEGFNPAAPPDMPDLENTGENGTLTVAISSDYMPFSYLGDSGVNLGFDIELAHRFAASQNKNVEFIDMAFSGLLPYVMSGKADIAISDIAITEERKKSVLFTDPYFTDLSAIVYMRGSTAAAEETAAGFAARLKTGIERNLITDNRWKMIVSGLGVTMTIAVLAQIFGTAFACFVCLLLTRKNRLVRRIGNLYCGLIYGTPIVVLLMITYYIIFGNTNISNVLVAIAAFSMITGATVATGLKGAIETVDTVEIEAARSIGFTAFKAFRTVTLPQAVRRALPGYTNGFVELVKATAIVGYIAIQDLTRAGDIIRSRTYDAYFPLLFVAIIYLIVTAICVQIFKFIVKRYALSR